MLWPRLSETLDTSSVLKCQKCGSTESLARWQECDDNDRGEMVFVVLCRKCADEIIEPHPRLYREYMEMEVAPGAMPTCEGCPQRQGARCKSPAARFNGGKGIWFHPGPQRIHLCRAKNSAWKILSEGPITHCSGRGE